MIDYFLRVDSGKLIDNYLDGGNAWLSAEYKMTIDLMNTFLAAVRSGNIPAAAGFLGVNQVCVSSRLQMLENNIGFPLIQRGKHIRSIILTEKGQQFFALSPRIMALLYDVENIRAPLRPLSKT